MTKKFPSRSCVPHYNHYDNKHMIINIISNLSSLLLLSYGSPVLHNEHIIVHQVTIFQNW